MVPLIQGLFFPFWISALFFSLFDPDGDLIFSLDHIFHGLWLGNTFSSLPLLSWLKSKQYNRYYFSCYLARRGRWQNFWQFHLVKKKKTSIYKALYNFSVLEMSKRERKNPTSIQLIAQFSVRSAHFLLQSKNRQSLIPMNFFPHDFEET